MRSISLSATSLFFSCRSLGLFQTNSGASTVLVDKLDACAIQRTSNYVERRPTRLVYRRFELTNCDNSNSCSVSQLLLTSVKQSSSGSALFRRDHPSTMHKPLISSILSEID